jgi:hypothetical protein
MIYNYNYQTASNKIELLTEYESVTQKVLFGNAFCGTDSIDKLFKLHFHIPQAVLFCYSRFENYRPWKPRQ